MNSADLDAFARLLDGDLPEGEATAEARVLSAFARALETSAAAPQMESKAELRMALIEAAREQAAAPSLLARLRNGYDATTSRWRYSMRVAAASGATAMALSSGGVALASARSMPSDLFYGVKLAYEDVRVAMIGDPVARAEAMMAYAELRMVEAELAAADGDMDAVRRALIEADESSRGAAGYIIRASQAQGDPSLLALLDDFAATYRKRLSALLPLLGGDAAAAAEDAMIGLRRISQRVAVLNGPCTQCDSRAAAAGGGGADKTRAGGGKGDDVAASDPDFDFAHIPPADEPFAPCPCSTGGSSTVDSDKAKKKAAAEKKDAKNAAADKPAAGGDDPADKPAEPGDEPPDDPGDKPGDGGNEDQLPDPPEELPDEIEKPANDAKDVIEDVLDDAPTELPDLPDLPEGDTDGVLP